MRAATGFNRYHIKYVVGAGDGQPLAASNAELLHLCADLAKKMKNMNFIENSVGQECQQSEAELDFDYAQHNSISIWDFKRVLVKVRPVEGSLSDGGASTCQINFIQVMPSVPMEFQAIDGKTIKLVSTPLSRLLIGKFTEKDRSRTRVLNFEAHGSEKYSGFLSLDQDKRIYPLLANFQDESEENKTLPIVGLWFYNLGETDANGNPFNTQFVYA